MSDLFNSPSPPQATSIGAPPSTTGDKKAHKEQPRIRRRNRLITSCLECRRRKLKCDKTSPCGNCTKFSRQCVFIAPGLDPEGQAKLAEVKEKMGMLERTLEEDVARRSSKSGSPFSSSLRPPTLPGQGGLSDQEDDEETKGLEPTYLATQDAAYYEDDGNDDIVDLGISMGKLRITERIGGLVRPRISEELTQALNELPKSEKPNPLSEQTPDMWMAPGRDYVAPSSSFFFAPGVEKTSLMTFLPSRNLCDKLMAHYWQAVHVLARTVHRPSFESSYETFWSNINSGIEPRISFQAVVFAALLSSIIAMSEDQIVNEFGVDKQSLVDNFRQGAESALSRANFLRTTKLETLQAFVMYLIPLCRAEVSRAHSALTGMCIRLAECMGLHRDPTNYSSSPVEIHVRRLVWYQICFLDLRTCEATGPRPQIRREEYDTRFPLNVDDVDLDRAQERGEEINEDQKYFTDMTITRMRFECYEMHRLLWTERPKMERKGPTGERKTTLTSILSRIQSFKAAMEKTYLPMFNKSVPLHVLAMEIYGILSDRMYIMILHKFMSNDKYKMPERIRQIMISASVMILEHSMTIEQQPALATWSWYVGALHQYHTALLLVSEMNAGARDSATEARIWRCLDFAFELSPTLSATEKTRMILEELAGRTQTYAQIRRMRAPINMPHVGPRTHTEGYQQRKAQERLEEQEREERGRSGSVQSAQSGNSPFSISSSSPPGHHPHQQNPPMSGPIGAMPNVDWGSLDLAAPSASPNPPPISSAEAYNFGGFAPAGPPPGLLSASLSPGPGLSPGRQSQGQGSDTSSNPGMAGGGGGLGGAASGHGGSPMDALNEIDWNEWEQLFGGAEMGAGNMLIPPFTFPQFSPTDLQWPQDGAGGSGGMQ